ncbi:unnamed protein product [Phytophthora lilii]|uniref:Unnamed protein product n=1 Tax=Phytophthora lilii TaxID=2077276 RepID=A0A9W6WST3_9STRA|nr:unnamed protein product [Phytophthora lilii]
MGAQASRDAGAESAEGPPDPQAERLAARAWRTGVPFTLLHDEGFVVEKYQELLAASPAQTPPSGSKALEEAQTTVSGLDEAPMDEMQHATDVARVKLFARTKRAAAEQSKSRPASPSRSAAATSPLTSSADKENPPSALAGMVGNTLSRESPESVESEKLRTQRDELLQIYFKQIAARMRQQQVTAVEESLTQEAPEDVGSTDPDGLTSPISSEIPMIAQRRKITQDVTAANVFAVGSLRMQLEMLREFRVLSPRLFEKGTMALVQTLLDSPPFALREVVSGSAEDAMLCDLHKFCRDMLHRAQGEYVALVEQRQVILLLLLAVGVSSGRISLLLEFVDELLAMPREMAMSALPVQDYPFSSWLRVLMQRMQSYRIEFALGSFEDGAFRKKIAVKALPGGAESESNQDGANESQASTVNPASSSLATDGNFAYTWSMSSGLAKIGTGHNFTIAVKKLVYGFGDHVKDVTEVAREELVKCRCTHSTESSRLKVHDIFGATDNLQVSPESSLLLLYSVSGVQNICFLDSDADFALPTTNTENAGADISIFRAWYGDLVTLNTDAMLAFSEMLEQKKCDDVANTDNKGLVFTREIIKQLLTLSGIPPEAIEDPKKVMVIFADSHDSVTVGAQMCGEGDQFDAVVNRSRDACISSLVYCDDSLYLNVTYLLRDGTGVLLDGKTQRYRRLLRISPRDLGFLEVLSVDASPSVTDSVPLCVYVTEGRHIYEIDMGLSNIQVCMLTPKAVSEGGKELVVTRKFILNEKSVPCCEFMLCLARIRSMLISNEEGEEVKPPLFYTNGALIGVLITDPPPEEGSSSKNRAHCLLFDCESGQRKELHESGASSGCLQRSLSCVSVCFDAKNNLLWAYDEHKRVLRSYQNSGKRIPSDENSIPVEYITRHLSNHVKGDEEVEIAALSLLGFLYKNAMASEPFDTKAEENNCFSAMIPFAVDVDPDTFKVLLAFTSKYVDIFKTNDASLVQAYILQACLGVLNKNLEKLLELADGPHKRKSIALLVAGLSAPLEKLLEFSSERQDSVMQGQASVEVPGGVQNVEKAGERSRIQVASVALDLYTSSIRIFHSDVSKQIAHVLKYLQLWQQSKATKMELKILARLLAHLCTRVDAIYHSVVVSDDGLGQFLKLVEIAEGIQQWQIRQVYTGSKDMLEPISTPGFPHSHESSFELTSLVNAITQASFVSLINADDPSKRRAFVVATAVFNATRDACSSICNDLADHVKQRDCQVQWSEIESVLKDGFVGIMAPVVLSSGITFLRKRDVVEVISSNSASINSVNDINLGGSANDESLSSCLFEVLKDNSSKLLKFVRSLDVLVSMIDPAKRERTVENVSMALKTETMESSHEYENNMDELKELQVPGATRMVITFDPRSRTEVNYDYLTFYKDKSQGEYYGNQFYSGRDSEQNWPGLGENPPLIIENDHCFVYFHTDGSNTDWGYKFTATAEILERKKSLQQHWIVFLLESVVQLLDESVKLLVDGSAFSPIEDIELQNEQYLQSDLLKSGICAGDSKNAEVLQLLQDFVDPPESSAAEKVIQALQERSGVARPGLALARSTSFDQITSSSPNKCVNSAVRAVAAAILHHNMWGMDAYAYTQNLRNDVSEQLLRGWKNAQKMRDWFHLGDAADAGIHGQMVPNRRRSGRMRRQPSAYKGLSEESLSILCDNVIERAKFLLEITPVSFAYVTGAKRRWGLLAKYGHAIRKHNSSDTQLDKWYNLLDELQAATELRSLFQYRRSSSERLKYGQVKSVTEQVLEFIQSDVDVSEVREVIAIRNRRAASRALGMEIFIESLKDCSSLRLRGIMLESFTASLKCFALANSPTNVSGSASASPVSAMDSFPRLHFDTLLSGCDEYLRQQIAEAFGNCLSIFAKQLALATDDGTCSALVTGVLRCCAIDYDLEDSYLLQESRILPQILRLLSSESVPTRNAAQSLLGVLLSRFISGRIKPTPEEEDEMRTPSDGHDVSAFQRQLFSAVGHQLHGIVSAVKYSLNSSNVASLGKSSPQYLPENSPGFTAPCLQKNVVSWNHSIMLWVYTPSKGPLYALKVGDEVRRGPNWNDRDNLDNCETEIGTVIGIPTPTMVHVRWNSSGVTSQCEFDPKRGIFDVVLVDEGGGGTIFFKGNKTMIKDTAAAKPWSYFGLFLTDKRMLVYKIACGSDKESIFETDYEMDADQWSHVAIVQDEDILKVYVNGSMVSQHLLESFLVMNANVNPAESAIIESAHPLEDSIDEYCPVHIPGAVKIRLTFDPLCDIDGSTGFVRFYKDATCVEYWGEEKYTGKYSDPERNFPGAQSNRARTQQSSDGLDIDLNVLEIPSDRFLVYFHNEGSSNSWGFRILASPEFVTSEEESVIPVSHLNPYPFYFGEAPSRVLDEPAAKCWIYQPKVLDYPISENDLTNEIQASFPSAEIVSSCVPAERTLHILGLIRTCTETSFGRSLVGTPENVRNVMFLSFDDRVPIEVRIGAIKVLKDLVGVLDPEIMDAQLAMLTNEGGGFLSFVFKRLGSALNVWRAYDEDSQNVASWGDGEGVENECILELRSSAQGQASLVAAYISLLRGTGGCSCWGDQLYELVRSGLQSVHVLGRKFSEQAVGRVLASLALLGGSYEGAYIGGRVSCCVNVDGKEMVETGFLVQFRMKSGTQIARVIFDCDQTSTVDVPLTDIAHLDDIERAELSSFLELMVPFASELQELYQCVLNLSAGASLRDGSYQPKLTKKENVEVLESEHPYAPGEDVTYSLNFRGASEIVVRFDQMSCTAGPNDYIQFRKRESDIKEDSDQKYWGDEKYYGESFPGMGSSPPLRIPAGCVDVHFCTEGSPNGISEWGFKLTAHAFEEALVYPPEIPPTIMTSAVSDIQARCIKSLGQVLRSQKRADIVPTFSTLLPLLAKVANTPSEGRPIQSSPKSQIFESKHPYANSVMEYMKVTFSGASSLTITFDPQSRTEQGCDYLCFFKDKSLTDRWGAYQYCGVGSDANWPGVEERPPLVIPADSFTLLWTTDGSNVDWGWKFNVTAEFIPEFPLDKSLQQLNARSYRLFETLYEKMIHQRIPLKNEFEEFLRNETSKENQNSDSIRQLLVSCRSNEEVNLTRWGSAAPRKLQQFRVTDDNGVKVYHEKNRESAVLTEFSAGIEFMAETHLDGWLKVVSENSDQLSGTNFGWVWQRTGENIHANLSTACANGEDLLTLGVDDLNFESRHSVLEMDESNDEEKSLTGLCSPFAFDELKGQTDRVQSLAYDTHRAMATKAARDAILTFLAYDPKQAPIQLNLFGDTEDILLLLSHFFLGDHADSAYDNKSGVLIALQKRLKEMVSSGVDDSILWRVLVRCLEILKSGPGLLPKGRGVVRILESTHPYQDNADQYWDVSIPGATKIKVIFDRRSKSEAGCDWIRFYKSGSNRSETIGPDQIGGRGDSENWPGTGDRPPLIINDDSFEVYFHSDSSNNDWGFKLYAIGIFKDEENLENKMANNPEPIVRLLSMASWILVAMSSIPDARFKTSPETFKVLYSAETLRTLMLSLDNLPQCIKTSTLQILSNISQSAAFHTIPAVLIEQLRDLLSVKMRAKYLAEDRVELKSPFLQALVQCAVAVDLSIDSHCFNEMVNSNVVGAQTCVPCLTKGLSTHTSTSSSGYYQFQLTFVKLVSAVSFGLMDGTFAESEKSPILSVQWKDCGKISIGNCSSLNSDHTLVEIAGYQSRIQEGDTVIIQLDVLRQTLVFRKNSVAAGLVAGPTGSGSFVSWDALQPPLHNERDMRLVVSNSSSENRIEFSVLSCSPVALIPHAVMPNWYNKVVDAVSMMMDFHSNLSSAVMSRESSHPMVSSTFLKPTREDISIKDAVALEIRFDAQTKLQKNDELRFHTLASDTSVLGGENLPVVFSGINGELDEKKMPHLFVSEGVKQPNHSFSVGDLVVRSPDWEYSDEDGGAGAVGTVLEITAWGPYNGKALRVRWNENGFESLYRNGMNGRYDVQHLDNSKQRNAPFIISGDRFSYEFVPGTPQTTAKLDLSTILPEFVGSLELDGSLRLNLTLLEENNFSLSEGDWTIEFWAWISKDTFESDEGNGACSMSVEVLRIGGTSGQLILTSDQRGICNLSFATANANNELVDAGSTIESSGNLVFDQWIHLALVFSGSRVNVVKNGDIIYSVRCSKNNRQVLHSNPVLTFGDSCRRAELLNSDSASRVSCLAFRGHLYDIRLWDVAFRVEQLRSHSRGLDSVETVPRTNSRPGTPTSNGGKALSPSMTYLSSPRSPRQSLRPVAVPQHIRKWVTTNRTGKDLSTVRLNCSLMIPALVNRNERSRATVAYYEAHALSSGSLCIGWILDGADVPGRSVMIGEERGSFGIDLSKKQGLFSASKQDLLPFARVEPSGCSSPRRSLGSSSSTNDIFCRSSDVIGCTINLETGKLTFYVNGGKVAECAPCSENERLDSNEDSAPMLNSSKDHEFDALVSEIIAEKPLESSATVSAPTSACTRATKKCYPSASLGPQGAQGLAWNFGQRPFKYEPDLDGVEIQSILQASGCTEDEALFEIYDHDELHWSRIVYRHKVQEIDPHLVGWWKLNEGQGSSIDDSSGNSHHGTLTAKHDTIGGKSKSTFARILEEENDDVWWSKTCSPPAVARRRVGDCNSVSPFFSLGSSGDNATKAEAFWGYKFYVIPHFTLETVGRRRFQSPSIRFGGTPVNLLPRHDHQLIKYANKKGQSKELNVTQLLHGPWSDIAPQENELVRWPALVEIVTSTRGEVTEKVESKIADSNRSLDPPLSAKSLVDVHGRLSKRFKILQEFNAAIYRILPFVAFHAPSIDSEINTHSKQFLLSDFIMEHRYRILSAVKRTVWESAIDRTNESGVSFELTLNRPKAMRFRATGKTDAEGRHTLFSQAFRQLQSLDGTHFRRNDALYHVTFLGENAQDAGGPYRETFAQYCEELQSPQLPLMLPTPNSQHNVGVGREKWLLSPGAQSATALQMLEFLGKLMGASIRSKQYLALNMASLVWKKLAGERLGLDDLAAVDSMLVNSMSKMRTIDRYGVTEEMFEDIVMETFTTLGADNRVIELKPGGTHLPVTFTSRCEYADLVEQARLHESDDQSLAIFRGLAKVVPAKLLACFSGAELELMVCGSPEINVDLLEKCTEYSSCSPTDDHIIWFWRALRDFSHEERSAFLRFVWGRSRLPSSADEFPQRFKLQSFNQQRAGRSVDAYMPVAHTCFFSVEIPAYSSESVLREKLMYAIYNCQEIDGDGDSVAANQLGWEE